ncbi:MAG: PqqD family protein [Candidatus Aminicenantes bacterium]|jgi:hypothetical protein
MAKKDKKINFLDLIPERNCQWEENRDGKIDLLVPRFKNRLMKKIALKLGKSEFITIHLDALGSKVWDRIDGSHTVEQIGELMEKENEAFTHQLYERLTDFLSSLSRHRFIRFKDYQR